MPGANPEELVRRFYEAWNRSGPAVLTDFASAEVELEDAPELPDAGVWRGREEVRRRLEEVAAHVGGGRVEIREVRAYGPRVLVAMEWRLGGGGGAGASVGEVFHVVGVAAGEVASIRVFLSEGEARAAAAG